MKFKLAIFLMASIAVCVAAGKLVFLPFCIAELLLIFAFTLTLGRRHLRWANVLNALLLFIYSSQLFIYYFTGEFISLLMLENVDMMSSLGDELVIYVLTALPFIIILFLPLRRTAKLFGLTLPNLKYVGLAAVVYFVSVGITASLFKIPVSPLSASAELCMSSVKAATIRFGKLSETERQQIVEMFYRDSIPGTDVHLIPSQSENPNIIFILTEGLSAGVLDVYNGTERNLTPNIDNLYSRSVVFDNYFNHTAATFRALRGQIFSSYQYQGGYQGGEGLGEMSVDEVRSRLDVGTVSLIDILNDRGYNTCYVNPEPGVPQIVEYARSFGVDTLMSGTFRGGQALTDRQIFDVLAEAVHKHEKKEGPYFIMFYNLGTHHGFDSPDIRYGDGTNPYLNKFHNYDYWFGKFIDEMTEAGIFENTLLVFTADHASYPAPDFKDTFKTERDVFISSVPLMIYTDGIVPCKYDVRGRNSLDLTPTLLDLLDVEDCANIFLGTSLFRGPITDFSYISAVGDSFYGTFDGEVRKLKGSDSRVRQIKKYYRISLND